MRIWDVPPGYLNRQSLLGEHRELHGLHSVLVNGKLGYSRHPETRRWVGRLSGLARRHALLVAEMRIRGYSDRSPVFNRHRTVRWPDTFVTAPAEQYDLLRAKYVDRQGGRIPLPRSPQELWAHHKYSVLARSQLCYRSVGRRVSRMRRGASLSPLAEELVRLLRQPPAGGDLANAVAHMWGHVARSATLVERADADRSLADLMRVTYDLTIRLKTPYLITSTALGELAVLAGFERRARR